MSFFLGFILGAAVTLYLLYRKSQKKKNESVRKPSSDNKSNEKEEDYL